MPVFVEAAAESGEGGGAGVAYTASVEANAQLKTPLQNVTVSIAPPDGADVSDDPSGAAEGSAAGPAAEWDTEARKLSWTVADLHSKVRAHARCRGPPSPAPPPSRPPRPRDRPPIPTALPRMPLPSSLPHAGRAHALLGDAAAGRDQQRGRAARGLGEAADQRGLRLRGCHDLGH